MDALHDRAGMGNTLKDNLLLFVNHYCFGEVERYIDTGDPTGIGLHNLLDGHFHAFQVNLVVGVLNAHGRSHTGGKGGSYQVGGRETLPSALVVGRSIGLYF